MDCISAIVLIYLVFLSVILRNTIDVGLIGYAIVYTLALSGLMQWTVRQSAEVETQMTSIERISTYSTMAPEPGYRNTLNMHLEKEVGRRRSFDNSKDVNQKTTMEICKKNGGSSLSIRGLKVKYRDDLDLVIKDLSFHIPSGCKIGIVGRTGSGKSTLFLAFLRLNIITAGDIFIDGKSLLEMDLEDARGYFSVIPQDAHLFSGTVRFNLDPFNVYSDAAIWQALTDAHINEFVAKDPLQLLMKVEEAGSNLSVGQRQLLSLSRAILRRSSIVLMDEVTASIDYFTGKSLLCDVGYCQSIAITHTRIQSHTYLHTYTLFLRLFLTLSLSLAHRSTYSRNNTEKPLSEGRDNNNNSA